MPTTAHSRSYREAMEARDPDGVAAACAPGVVLHSPISRHARFEGRAQVRDLLAEVLQVTDEFRYVDEVAAGDTIVYRVEGRVAGQPIEETIWVRLDDDGLVREFRVFARPLAAVTAFLGALAPRLGRRRGRLRGLVLKLFVAPLAWITRTTDGLGARLALGRR